MLSSWCAFPNYDCDRCWLVSQVEDKLYNIHRYFLEQYWATFASKFLSNPAEAATDEHPIHLPGVESSEFYRLLCLFYPKLVMIPIHFPQANKSFLSKKSRGIRAADNGWVGIHHASYIAMEIDLPCRSWHQPFPVDHIPSWQTSGCLRVTCDWLAETSICRLVYAGWATDYRGGPSIGHWCHCLYQRSPLMSAPSLYAPKPVISRLLRTSQWNDPSGWTITSGHRERPRMHSHIPVSTGIGDILSSG